jgi:signal transduction histidine kinase
MWVVMSILEVGSTLITSNMGLRDVINNSDSAIEKLLGSMIHEFRGPINSMICNLELLEVSTKG